MVLTLESQGYPIGNWIGMPRLGLAVAWRSVAGLAYPVSGIQGWPRSARVMASRAPGPWRVAVWR